MSDKTPLLFEPHMGMLKPANRAAEEALREVRGRVRVKMTGGTANQKRRALYWLVVALVVPLLNAKHGMTLDEDDLHDILRTKCKLYDEHVLPSGEVHRKLRSTSNRAMAEPERAAYTDRALQIMSTWVGVDVTTLKAEAEA